MTVVASPIKLAALSAEALFTTWPGSVTAELREDERLLREDLLPEALEVCEQEAPLLLEAAAATAACRKLLVALLPTATARFDSCCCCTCSTVVEAAHWSLLFLHSLWIKFSSTFPRYIDHCFKASPMESAC